MSELHPFGALAFYPDPVQQTRSDKLDWPWTTAEPAAGAENTVQPFFNLRYTMPRTDYLAALNPSTGYPVNQVPTGTDATPGLTGGSNKLQNAAGGALRTSAEALRQWLLGIRLMPSPFPTVGSQTE